MLFNQEKNWAYLSLTVAIVNILLLLFFLTYLIYITSFSSSYIDRLSIIYLFILFPIYYSGITIGYGFGTYFRLKDNIILEEGNNPELRNNFNRNMFLVNISSRKIIKGAIYLFIVIIMLLSREYLLKIGMRYFFQGLLFLLPIFSFNYFWNLGLEKNKNKYFRGFIVFIMLSYWVILISYLTFVSIEN